MTTKTLTATELKKMIDRGNDVVLINVLPESEFEEAHIPGSHNVPLERETFLDEVAAIAGNKARRIVVYCASRDCRASPKAAAQLGDAGYTNVLHYADGLTGWRRAGFEVTAGATATR